VLQLPQQIHITNVPRASARYRCGRSQTAAEMGARSRLTLVRANVTSHW
jgi:hypothetical protein